MADAPKHVDDFENLVEEVRKNARLDRERMITHIEKISDATSENPELSVLSSEQIIKSVDCMVRSNAQLIQLAQLKLKKVSTEDPQRSSELSKEEIEKTYGEIGGAFDTEEKKN